MPRVIYVTADGAVETVVVSVGQSLMDGAVDQGISGIRAQCGGGCTCATCHCYVREPWFARLPLAGADERELLEHVFNPRRNSRLACQVRVTRELDGVVVDLPLRQI